MPEVLFGHPVIILMFIWHPNTKWVWPVMVSVAMRLTRRNTLIGLGAAAAGAGAIGGTGAFTSVEADRSVSVSTAGDAGAALQILPADDGDGSATQNALEYTNANGPDSFSGDTLSISLSSTDSDDNSAGLNVGATTRIEDLFRVTNNGTEQVDLDFQITDADSDGNNLSDVGTVKILIDNGSGYSAYDLESESWAPSNSDDKPSIDEGSSGPTFGLELVIPEDTDVDTTFDLDLTIRAQT